MILRIKTSLLVFILLFIYVSSGLVEGVSDGVNPLQSLSKDGIKTTSRKLLAVEVLDYDDAGANSRHEPRKGKPGGGKNP